MDTRHKRGDRREDGLIFWQYQTTGLPLWVDEARFTRMKEAHKARQKEFAKTNKGKAIAKEAGKKWRDANPGVMKEYMREYDARPEAKQKRKAYAKTPHGKVVLARYRSTPDSLASIAKHTRERFAKDAKFAISRRITVRTLSLFYMKEWATDPILTLLGGTWEVVFSSIESHFQPGMSWENRSKWQLDHLVPFCAAQTREDAILLCHFSNLRPVWVAEHRKKSISEQKAASAARLKGREEARMRHRRRRGDIREDGRVFWQYGGDLAEIWYESERYAEARAKLLAKRGTVKP